MVRSNDIFCNYKFKKFNTTIHDATKKIFDEIYGIYNHNAALKSMNASKGPLNPATNDSKTAPLLRSSFASYLQSEQQRISIPALIYRATRCTADDEEVLQPLFR